ncbi:MAG TPA: S8 family peptidase [Rhizomicrobium sp.]
MTVGYDAQAATLRLTADTTPQMNTIEPFYGAINPFYGSINPFYGSINPFYGQISPFWGDISPFWGTINPFYGSINPFYGPTDQFWGTINPFYGNINPFFTTVGPYWQSAGPQWGAINNTWNQLQTSNATDYSGLQIQIKTFLSHAETFWGPAVERYTGKDFDDGFANGMLAKYGIDPNDPQSLANADPATRSYFFLNWYDGLMNFTGVDHVDWWMPSIDWSPMLAQTEGNTKAVVGLLDSTATAAGADVKSLNFVGGYNYYVNGHGTATASLIAAQQDGTGVMGVAPNSTIALYNPFDSTGTASWTDVAQGIATLYNNGAHVVNASLGVPGTVVSNEWVNILSGSLLSGRESSLVIVKAAGNEGVTQTQNVPWLLGLEAPNNLIIVGSVGPTGAISPFSNTPGQACFTILGLCAQQNKLMYHYLVAPGELDLVSDGNGGVTRMSGTSFAAPLVTGAVALLEERWPWLDQHANETAQIIFQSAKDLGAPGVDPVYGWGELDVEASQSPLNFDNLTVYQPNTYNGKATTTPLLPNSSARSLKSAVLSPGQLNLWQQKGAYVVAFETIGTTYRDFTIPLSSMLVGKTQTVNGVTNQFQSYLYQRLIDWANGANFLGYDSQSVQLAGGDDWQLGFSATQSSPDELREGNGPFHAQFAASDHDAGIELRLGEGGGAYALTGGNGFAWRSDFDPSTGGVNPVLGFASGGMYASGGFALTSKLKVNLGFSEKSDDHSYVDPVYGRTQDIPLPTSRASASVAGIDYAVTDGFSLNASYTGLDEANGLLGSDGSGALALSGGAHTQGETFGATARFGNGWTLSGSATLAHTSAPQGVKSGLTLAQDGLQSTAFEFAVTKAGLFSDVDSMRVSLTQPLHVESGALNYTSIEVTDRDTGALGPVTQTWNIAGNRELRLESMYSVPVLSGRANIDAFGLVDMNPPSTPQTSLSVSVGAQFRIGL